MAEKGGTWVITKKVFFDLSKNAVFFAVFEKGLKTTASISEYRAFVNSSFFLFDCRLLKSHGQKQHFALKTTVKGGHRAGMEMAETKKKQTSNIQHRTLNIEWLI